MRLHRCPTHPASAVGRAVPVGHMWRSNVQENAPTHDVVTVRKTHVVSGMSLAMKNLMGLLPREDRRAMHTFGIQQCIVDLNRGVQPDLSIVDGSVGQEGEGPLYGQAANLGLLVAGRDS